ncbi:MBL fold metallo-hydrolase [Methanococcus voltae]|uniref:Glyoxylase-like metal-dependent hydrolase (Beta-lactamase superfamily II) n=1 Tax=Methanococcus voltae TaxID=2188 RepID=A0A8J7S209_METVO|nr:MBL fold metallo-hydrolase [Methanococcus voltae]MBP2173039.1 glyoxylase-like metal-dependent hydrolase (beta-lactamase superfamily II) [Methanococcus voltae]MBP2201905.1 glyoxylase-like metal-dependent hydrolase (beta-lactamase superfamily II) [Methanococcus voltae]
MIKLIYTGDITYSSGLKPLSASSSVTYIEEMTTTEKNIRIVIDTSTKDKKEFLINKFNNLGVKLENIDYIINTHHHYDHVENNDLFENAKIINYSNYKDFEEKLLKYGIKIIEVLGHTMDSIAVIYGDYIISGDAIPVKNNIFKNLPPKVHINKELATESLNKIKNLRKNIITGHDGLLNIEDYVDY